MEETLSSWRRYADSAGSLYRPQVMARGQDLDWERLADDVSNDIEIANEAAIGPLASLTLTLERVE